MKRILAAIVMVLIASGSMYAERSCSPDQVYSDPLGSIGCSIEFTGRVKKIISVSFPMEFVINAGGRLFLVQYFPKIGTSGTAVSEGKKYSLKGSILGSKNVLYDGSMVSLPQIYCIEIQ